MMKLDTEELKRKSTLGDNDATKILRVRESGSYLLCSLLLANTAVNSAISVLMSSLTTGILAGLISTFMIVIFGEIMPQAFFSRHALKFGSKMTWFVRCMMWIFWPIAKPISILIDKVLGEEVPTRWGKREIAEIIKDHEEESIDAIESKMVLGALSFSDKCVSDIMTPTPVVFMISEDEIFDQAMKKRISEESFSRIPVYREDKDNVIGILYTKCLLDKPEGKKIGEILTGKEIVKFAFSARLDSVLNTFLKKRLHIGFVYNEYGSMQGIVTLEDIVEEILKTEIVDESDDVIDMQDHARKAFQER
jgi:metal transporter CNNM